MQQVQESSNHAQAEDIINDECFTQQKSLEQKEIGHLLLTQTSRQRKTLYDINKIKEMVKHLTQMAQLEA